MSTTDLEIRQQAEEVLVRYASGIDRRDWDLLRSCFTEDCTADYGPIGTWHVAEEITEWMRKSHEGAGHTLHRITNVVASLTDTGAVARSYVDGLVLFPDNTSGTRATGYYDDELVVTDDGWKIARRRFSLVLLQLLPEGTIVDIEAVLGQEQA